MVKTNTAIAAMVCISYGPFGLAQDAAPTNTFVAAVIVVEGVPFSAQAVTESIQVLADGNRIARTNTAFVARDGEGRTRREQGPSGAGAVFIHDPVAGISYVLESHTRSARKIAILLTTSEAAVDAADSGRESLGTQIIDGLLAQGTRETRTVPPGQSGNERAIQVVLETWYSAELQTVIMSRHTDPRLGETVYRLTDIQRGEPVYSLFQVPADYTVREELSPVARKPANTK